MTYKLPEAWQEVELKKIVQYETGKLNSNAAEVDGKYPFFTCAPNPLKINKYKYDKEAVILAGNNAGGIFHVNMYNGKFNAYQRTYIMETKDDSKLINTFLYYSLIINLNHFKTISSGSATRFLTRKIIDGLNINLPTLPEQKVIADTLSSIDDKIENNNKINENLEEQAQAIFKHWFVDFEFPDQEGNPYRSSGGEMVESELGLIPKRWEVVKLEELVLHIESGNWGKGKEEGNYIEKVLCIRGTDIPDIKKGEKDDMPIRYIIPRHIKNKSLKDGDIVVEMSGGSPTQSTGRALYVNDKFLLNYPTPILCTNFCKIFKVEKAYQKLFYYNWEYLYSLGHMFSFENGTTGIKNLDEKSLLKNNLIPIPSKNIVRKFNKYIGIINRNKVSLGNQNQKLSQLRDTLLPKLMSGEIRIPLD